MLRVALLSVDFVGAGRPPGSEELGCHLKTWGCRGGEMLMVL
jgi:hypothetical protein